MDPVSPGFALLLAAAALGAAGLPPRWRPAWLLGASLWAAAAGGGPGALLWLGGVAALAGGAGAAARRARTPAGRRLAVGAGCGALAALLAATKFGDALSGLLPVLGRMPAGPPGLSFLAFTAIAWIADAAREPDAPGGPLALGLHLAWFPKLLAGPIERRSHLVPQFEQLGLRPDLAAAGAWLILSGLLKKAVVAAALAPVVDAAYAIPAYAAPMELVIASYFFAFQVYADFSGYTDLARGASALVGLRLAPNFDRPYLARSPGEFWSARWHVSLGRFFRDLVYIPLGGSRRGRARQVLNLLAVFALSGLWHAGLGYGVGWGFLLWGLLNGALVAAGALLPGLARVPAPLRRLATFHLILVTWVVFRAATPGDALTILRRVGAALPALPGLVPRYPFTAAHAAGAAAILALLLADATAGGRPWLLRLLDGPLLLRWSAAAGGLAALLLWGRWGAGGFIYAGF